MCHDWYLMRALEMTLIGPLLSYISPSFEHMAIMALAFVCYMYIVYICCLVSVLCFQSTWALFFYLLFMSHTDIQYGKPISARKDWKKLEKYSLQ